LRTKLPHISIKGYYQFITIRTQESIDEYILKLQSSSLDSKIKQYHIDNYLDSSSRGAYFYGDTIDILKEVILDKDGVYYDVEIFAIMPNHLHILLRQIEPLEKIMRYIKGRSAILLNRVLSRSGKFWLSGYLDKAIRDKGHFEKSYEYILNNPYKANLKDSDTRIYSKYEE
jgi:putative transposase